MNSGTPHPDALSELQEALARLFAAERRMRGREQREEGELTTAHVRALFALGGQDESTAGRIAEVARMSPASVTGVLDDLDRAALIDRCRSETDRRQVLVSLSAKGKALLSARQRLWESRFGVGLEGLEDREVITAATVIGRVAALLDEV